MFFFDNVSGQNLQIYLQILRGLGFYRLEQNVFLLERVRFSLSSWVSCFFGIFLAKVRVFGFSPKNPLHFCH